MQALQQSACMLSFPSSIRSGVSCAIANNTVFIMYWKVSEVWLKSPDEQCFMMFMTSLKTPSLNSGCTVVSCYIICSVGSQRLTITVGRKSAIMSPVCLISTENSSSTSGYGM